MTMLVRCEDALKRQRRDGQFSPVDAGGGDQRLGSEASVGGHGEVFQLVGVVGARAREEPEGGQCELGGQKSDQRGARSLNVS